MTEWVTLKVPDAAKRDAGGVKEDHGETWEDVRWFYATHRDDVTGEELYAVGDDEVTEVLDGLDRALADEGVSLTYDDVKAACAAAIQDECAPEVLER